MGGNSDTNDIKQYFSSSEIDKIATKETKGGYLMFKVMSRQNLDPVEIRLTPSYEPLYVSYRGYTGGNYGRGEALELEDIKQLITAYMKSPVLEQKGLFGISYMFSNGVKFNRKLS